MVRHLRKSGSLLFGSLVAAFVLFRFNLGHLERDGSHYVVTEPSEAQAVRSPISAVKLLGKQGRVTAHNSWGQAVGFRYAPGTLYFHACLWSQGKAQDIGTLGGRESRAYGLNDRGEVVGASLTSANRYHAFLWQKGRMQDLSTLGGRWSYAYSINDQGQVVGDSRTADGSFHAFLWQKGRMQDLGTLGGLSSHAYGLNDKGEVVGEADTAEGVSHAFLWQKGRMQDLGTLGGTQSAAYSINNLGQVVGTAADRNSDLNVAFLWQDGKMIALITRLVGKSGWKLWKLWEAWKITDSGQIFGWGELDNSQGPFLLTPVP